MSIQGRWAVSEYAFAPLLILLYSYCMKDILDSCLLLFATCLPHVYVHLLTYFTVSTQLFIFALRQNHGLVVHNFGRFGWQERWRALESIGFIVLSALRRALMPDSWHSKVAHRFRNNCVGPCGTWVFPCFSISVSFLQVQKFVGSSKSPQILFFSQVHLQIEVLRFLRLLLPEVSCIP